jgi:hypothetical protein
MFGEGDTLGGAYGLDIIYAKTTILDRTNPEGEAIAIGDGKIAAVGSGRNIAAMAGRPESGWRQAAGSPLIRRESAFGLER